MVCGGCWWLLIAFRKKAFAAATSRLALKPEVDCPSRPIDGTVQITPLTSDFDVCLVNAPRPTHCKGIAAPALLEFRGIVPDPSHNGCMCQRQAMLRHH